MSGSAPRPFTSHEEPHTRSPPPLPPARAVARHSPALLVARRAARTVAAAAAAGPRRCPSPTEKRWFHVVCVAVPLTRRQTPRHPREEFALSARLADARVVYGVYTFRSPGPNRPHTGPCLCDLAFCGHRRFSVSACRGRAVRVCGGAGQARSVCVCARCPAPVTPLGV